MPGDEPATRSAKAYGAPRARRLLIESGKRFDSVQTVYFNIAAESLRKANAGKEMRNSKKTQVALRRDRAGEIVKVSKWLWGKHLKSRAGIDCAIGNVVTAVVKFVSRG